MPSTGAQWTALIAGALLLDRAAGTEAETAAAVRARRAALRMKSDDGLRDVLSSIGGVTVTAFGAVGDGTTDDTPAFEAALAAAFDVIVPNGTYTPT